MSGVDGPGSSVYKLAPMTAADWFPPLTVFVPQNP